MQVWGGMFLSRSSLLLCVTGWTAVVTGTVDAWELAAPGAGNAGGWADFSVSTSLSLGLRISFHCSHLLEEPMIIPGEGKKLIQI